MLSLIGCYYKIMGFSHFKLEVTYIITHPRVTNDDAPSNLWKLLKCTIKMGITPQNMPQASNSLLSPTKSMAARGNQW